MVIHFYNYKITRNHFTNSLLVSSTMNLDISKSRFQVMYMCIFVWSLKKLCTHEKVFFRETQWLLAKNITPKVLWSPVFNNYTVRASLGTTPGEMNTIMSFLHPYVIDLTAFSLLLWREKEPVLLLDCQVCWKCLPVPFSVYH